jgi:hypothetical protein
MASSTFARSRWCDHGKLKEKKLGKPKIFD